MQKLRHSLAVGLLATVFSGQVQAAGVDGAQLQPVPVPVDSTCNRIFFRSSQHFNHTVFVVPHAVPGTIGQGDSRTFNFAPIPGANMQDPTARKWFLYLRLRFPSDGEVSLATGASSQAIDQHMCDFDTVKVQINRADPTLKVFTIAPIPLTSIQVNIPGVQDVGSIGLTAEDNSRIAAKDQTTQNNEPDIIQSNGETLTAIFKVTDAEKEFFQNSIVADGVTVTVRYRFQAQQRLGSITATVDTKSLAQNFKAAAKGQVSIAKVDVAAALKSAADSRSIQITSEGGAGDAFAKIQSQVIDKVLQEVSLGAQTAAPDAKGGDDSVPVQAILDVISTRLESNFSFNQMSLPERATAQQEVQFRSTTIYDSNIKHIRVQAGYSDPSTGFSLNAGQQINISPAYTFVEKIDYTSLQFVSYLSLSKINEMNLAYNPGFPDLRDPRMKLANNISDSDIEKMSDQPMGVLGKSYHALTSREGDQNVYAIGTYWLTKDRLVKLPGEYYWIRTKNYPHRSPIGFSKQVDASSLEAFKAIPMALSFSGLGDRAPVTFEHLFDADKNGVLWNATFDQNNGRLTLAAKVNLGTIQFRPRKGFASSPDDYQEAVVNTETVQEVHQAGIVGARAVGKPVVVSSDPQAIVKQRTMIFYVTLPETIPASIQPTSALPSKVTQQ